MVALELMPVCSPMNSVLAVPSAAVMTASVFFERLVKTPSYCFQNELLPKPVNDTLIIRKKKIPITIEFRRQDSLKFYIENPRVYSVVRQDEEEPSQDDIEAALRQREHVKQLRVDIESNGGLTDAVIVHGGTHEVVEGNSTG